MERRDTLGARPTQLHVRRRRPPATDQRAVAAGSAREPSPSPASATGSDLADFLLGIPHASSIAFGNADKYLRAPSYDAYITDDWRFGPTLTVNAGMRWEYEAPHHRAVRSSGEPGCRAGFHVSEPRAGEQSGRRRRPASSTPIRSSIPTSAAFQPRVGVAWRPVAGSSLVIRAGYGIYRNTSVYQSIATIMALRRPGAAAAALEDVQRRDQRRPIRSRWRTDSSRLPVHRAPRPTRLRSIRTSASATPQNWQASLQRDLPASLTVIATYLGTKGSHLMQEFLPNTYPTGAVNPCPTCPAGIRLSDVERPLDATRRPVPAAAPPSQRPDGDGAVHAVEGDGRCRRRLQASSLSGGAIAQDWLDLDAERAPSNFDQRHLVTAQFQYTTGVGVAGGALLTGVKGALFKGWT